MDDLDRRPVPPRPVPERLRNWLEWFGPLRLVTSAIAVLIVCVGVWWLVRTPTPPAESSLPHTGADAAVVSTTAVGRGDPAEAVVTGPLPSAEEPVAADGRTVLDDRVIVHVTGAVHRRGVYVFEPGERLADAIERAGGATSVGRPHELNLALPLTDGMRVAVPLEGEEVPPELRRDAPPPADDLDSSVVATVNVNTATAAELETLPGVGPATAAAILTDRERNGPFAGLDDLLRVPGIGPAKLAQLREAVTT